MIHRRSVVTGYCSIKSGESDVIVAGGQEIMSRAPHAAYLRAGVKFGNYNLTDTLIEDGLTDAFHNIHMAITGEAGVLARFLYQEESRGFNPRRGILSNHSSCCPIAENLAEKYAISREAQDNYASKSQQKAEAAIIAGHFDKEMIPVTIAGKKEPVVVSRDEFPKFGTTAEKLAKLRPAFRPVPGYHFAFVRVA